MAPPRQITAHDNPLLKRVRRLLREPGAYRADGAVWLDGEHLLAALAARGGQALQVLVAEPAWAADAGLRDLAQRLGGATALLPPALMAEVSGLESPARAGALVALAPVPAPRADRSCLLLDRLQDAGNVGSILRSASAFGVQQVLALRGTAALWSPKVLRAAQGAHFGLALHEGLTPEALAALPLPPLVGTDLQAHHLLPQAPLPQPCTWVLGHEGRGVAPELLARCALTVRIPQPGGEESLNVAAAAAVCLYESLRRQPNAG